MNKRLGAICLLLSLTSAAAAETPTRHVLDLWLHAFNSNDRQNLTAFWNVYNPTWQGINRELAVGKESGGITLVKVSSDDGKRLDAVVADAGETFLALSVELKSPVSANEPVKVDRIALHGVVHEDGLVPHFSNDAQLVSGVRATIRSLAKVDKFAGTVELVRANRVLFTNAVGEANRDTHANIRQDTKFRIGSMNKMFTAVAALQLIEQGKLSLDKTIRDYWPDYPNKEVAAKVTIRHLLTHTGGTGDIFSAEYNDHRLEIRSLSDYVGLYGNRALEFEPGSQFRYSNYGYLLLGLLIEKVSGQSYYDYVQEHIYAPAGMTGTGSLPEIDVVPGRAAGYMPGKKGWEPNTDTLPWRGTSAGGGYSTTGDLVRFSQALIRGKLINAYWLAEATKEQTPGSGYGYGFQTEDGYFGHSGAAPGINGELRIYPKTGHIIAALSNLEPPSAMRIAAYAGHRLPER